MGNGYLYSCPHCGEKNKFLEGVGMWMFAHPEEVFYGENPKVKDLISVELWEEYQTLIKNGWRLPLMVFKGRPRPFWYDYIVCYCPECKTMKQRFTFILTKAGEVYVPVHTCEACGTELKEWKFSECETSLSIICKKCNNKYPIESVSEICNWD
ncbi:MAG: hypothetical protein IKY09_00285 [Methanocorpusculum sp.]|nr:hypothetical protein [Methanocorpusculum sp.]MBR5451359.1 hypothetical protein [Methanocorpusculum sp.]